MICPNCNTDNPDTAKFCANCGQSLAASPAPEVESGTQILPPAPATVTPSPVPQALVPAYPPPVPPYPPVYARPLKDRSLALILEIIPGLFGLFGIGWVYANNTNTGVLLIVGSILWSLFAIIIDIVTAGLACFCTLPVTLIGIAVSASMLNTHTKAHPELFGP